MEQSEMEVEISEVEKTDESSPQTTPSLPEKSSGPEPTSAVESPSQDTLKDEAQPNAPTNTQSASLNEETPQDISSDHSTNSQAISSDQTSASQLVSSDEAVPSSAIPPSSKVPVPGPSSETSSPSVASKLTNGPASKKQRLDYGSMSTGVYLDSTVVPILHLALVTLDRLRPEDPVQYVIDFLLRHKAQYSKAKEHPAPSASANQA